MTKATITAWLRQPTTVAGIATLLAVLAGFATWQATKSLPEALAIASTVLGVVKIALPDNAGAQSSIDKLVTDAVTAAATRHLSAALPALVADGMGVLGNLNLAPTTTTATTTTKVEGQPTATTTATSETGGAIPVVAVGQVAAPAA